MAISMKRNFSWMFLGNLFYTFTQWLVVTILAKLTSVSIVGAYTYALAVTAPIILFFYFQMRVLVSTDSNEEIRFSKFYTYRFLSMIFALFVIVLSAFFLDVKEEVKIIIILLGINKSLEGMSEICYGYFQQKEEMKYVSTSLIIRGVVSISMLMTGLYVFESLILSLALMNISWLFLHVGYDLQVVKKIFGRKKVFEYNRSTFLYLLKVGMPLGIVVMLGSLSTNIPRYIIEGKLGLKELGVYGALTYILVGSGKFFTTLTQVMSPRLANYYNKKLKNEFLRLFTMSLGIIITMSLFIIIIAIYFGEGILSLLYTEEYSTYNKLFVEIMVLGMFIYVGGLFGTTATAMKVYTMQVPIHVIKIILVTIFTIIFVDKYGVSGAAYALIIAYLFSLFFYGYIIIKKIKGMGES